MFPEFGQAPISLELDLDSYDDSFTHVAAFRGQSGWLLMARATIQSEHDMLCGTLIVACDERENPIPAWRAIHLTQCRWERLDHCEEESPEILDDLLCEEEGAFYARWQREMNSGLATLYDNAQRDIETLEAKAAARARNVDAQIADLRRRRRMLDASNDSYAALTEIIAELETQSDQEMARLAKRRAQLRRQAEEAEEALWQRTDVLIEVEPMCLVRWQTRNSLRAAHLLNPEQPGSGGISLHRLHLVDANEFNLRRQQEITERENDIRLKSIQRAAQIARSKESREHSNRDLPKSSPILRKLASAAAAPEAAKEKIPEPFKTPSWSQEQVELLEQCWTEGIPADEIAARLNKRKGQVIGKAHRIGLFKPRAPMEVPPPQQVAPVASGEDSSSPDRKDLLEKIANREELLRRYLPYTAEWFDLREAIKALHGQMATLDTLSQPAASPPPAENNSWSAERVEMLKGLWLGGATASQIAKALGGTSRNAVIGKAKRLGLPLRAEIEATSRHITETKLSADL